MDSQVDEQGREKHRDKTICSHTPDVLEVCKKHPDSFIPFLSVNPLRPEALDLIDLYYEAGCRGAKFLQNYWNVDTNQEKFVPYYEKLKKYNLPLVIHIGPEFTCPSFRKCESPQMLRLPLEVGVKVVAAHVGLGRFDHKILFWRNFSSREEFLNQEYFEVLAMVKKYPNLYTDISAILALNKIRSLPHLAKQTDIHDRLLFATDYPVPFVVHSFLVHFSKARAEEIQAIKNPFDRYYETIEAYFGKTSPIFSNWKRLLGG